MDKRVEKVERLRKRYGISFRLIRKHLGCSKMTYYRWTRYNIKPCNIYQKRLTDLIDAIKAIEKRSKEIENERKRLTDKLSNTE